MKFSIYLLLWFILEEYSSTPHLSRLGFIVIKIELIWLLTKSWRWYFSLYIHAIETQTTGCLSLEMNWPVKRLSFTSDDIALLTVYFELQYSESEFDGTKQYARNKRVQVCESWCLNSLQSTRDGNTGLTWSWKPPQVALTEWWAEKYSNKGVGFYSMHPGWADTPGVSKSLPGLSEKYAHTFSYPNNTMSLGSFMFRSDGLIYITNTMSGYQET